tara:strand:+ start:565 stop:693 length:129 start_codon:yes stop_codon:yes gene_type:complete
MKATNVIFRISAEDKKQLQQLAKENHLTVSSYIRMKSLTLAK